MSKKVTHEQFIHDMQYINDDIVIKGKYLKAKEPILCECKKCGYEWFATPSNLKKGRGCSKCSGHYHMTNDEFLKKVSVTNPSIEVLEPYVDMKTRIKVSCNICGKIWSPMAQSLVNGFGCQKCGYKKIAMDRAISADEVKKRMHEKHPEIEILGEYIDAKTPVKCHCTICGYTWDHPGKSMLNGVGCYKCSHQLQRTQAEFVE